MQWRPVVCVGKDRMETVQFTGWALTVIRKRRCGNRAGVIAWNDGKGNFTWNLLLLFYIFSQHSKKQVICLNYLISDCTMISYQVSSEINKCLINYPIYSVDQRWCDFFVPGFLFFPNKMLASGSHCLVFFFQLCLWDSAKGLILFITW